VIGGNSDVLSRPTPGGDSSLNSKGRAALKKEKRKEQKRKKKED
jgi:hypothetical protein